jgi:hypothetical protein
MKKHEIIKQLEEFSDDTDIIFYDRTKDISYGIDSVHGLFVDYLESDVCALEGSNIVK